MDWVLVAIIVGSVAAYCKFYYTDKISSETYKLKNEITTKEQEIEKMRKHIQYEHDNLKYFLSAKKEVMPYIAGMMADYLTLECDRSSYYLKNKPHPAYKEAQRIDELKATTKKTLAEYKVYEYQLGYLIDLYPDLAEVLEDEFVENPVIDYKEYDPIKDWISPEEYRNMPEAKRNQLALDRYNKNKNNWQIGRDYELYVGQYFENLGFKVDYNGMNRGYEDRGSDLIAKKDGKTFIFQCKYRGHKKTTGEEKQLHENSVTQLLGTTARYAVEHKIPKEKIRPYLITNKTLEEDAKKCAAFLGISYIERMEFKRFPQIKCNISKDGEKIYHLPMDQQYNKVKIDKPGECYAYTVDEAEQLGFRRAFRYTGRK